MKYGVALSLVMVFLLIPTIIGALIFGLLATSYPDKMLPWFYFTALSVLVLVIGLVRQSREKKT